jgi:hypothetical protein
MIYQNFNFSESYSNASGSKREQMTISELGKIVGQSPFAVREALRSAGVKVGSNVTRDGLIKKIIKNRNNKMMIGHLSALILASTKFDEKDSNFSNLISPSAVQGIGEATKQMAEQSQTADKKQKGGFFKKIGGFFKGMKDRRQAKANDPKVQERRKKFGSWFQANKGSIGSIANNLFSGLGLGGSAQNTMRNQSNNNANWNNNNNNDEQGMGLGAKIGIAVGVLAVIGVTIYLIRRKRK